MMRTTLDKKQSLIALHDAKTPDHGSYLSAEQLGQIRTVFRAAGDGLNFRVKVDASAEEDVERAWRWFGEIASRYELGTHMIKIVPKKIPNSDGRWKVLSDELKLTGRFNDDVILVQGECPVTHFVVSIQRYK